MVKKTLVPEKAANHERWLLTYADMITLLMTLFIVLYALSVADKKKFSELSKSLRVAFMGGSKSSFIKLENIFIQKTDVNFVESGHKDSSSEAGKMGDIQDQLYEFIEKQKLMDEVVIDMEERGLVIRLSEGLLFSSGQATIKPGAYKNLAAIGHILSKINYYIRVEGHTDSIPTHGSQFRSNWHLSSERSTRITEFLITNSRLNPSRFSAMGFGEYRPIATNTTEIGRAQNRRVDIILMKSSFNTVEENKPEKL